MVYVIKINFGLQQNLFQNRGFTGFTVFLQSTHIAISKIVRHDYVNYYSLGKITKYEWGLFFEPDSTLDKNIDIFLAQFLCRQKINVNFFLGR